MSNIPISSLPIAVALTGSEAVVMDQAGTTKTATVSLINAQNVANIPIGGLTGQALVKLSNVNYATTWKTVSGFGTVQEVDTGAGLTGGPITVTGTIALASIATGNVLANTTGVSAAPVPTIPSAILDVIGSNQGDLLYRSATGWTVLPPGTAMNILTTGGPGANPSWSSVGSGTVQSVGLALPSSILTVSGSPVTGTGTLTGALATQTANTVWAGPTTGSAATPTFRALVGADLPNPSATTLGGIQSTVGVSHQWVSSISTSGVPGLSQPAFTDISGIATGAQLPNPSPTTLGGIQSLASVGSKWINQISTSGVPSATQPAFSDLSGTASLAQLPSIGNNTVLSNISGGSATPLANSLTSIIDSSIASTQGDILYRNASSWVALAPGTSGQVLSSGGAAANPSWATVTGTGTVTSVATNNGLTGGTITSSGTIGLATITTGNVLANTTGSTAVPVATAPTAILDVIGATEGNILYRGASTWSALAPGTNGQFLKTPGSGSTPIWASLPGATISSVSVTGASTTYTGGQANFNVERSNSGSAMSDTLPGTSPGVLTSGTIVTVTNSDASGLLSMKPGAGATFKTAASSTGYAYLGPGQSLTFYSDGSNYWVVGLPDRCIFAADTSIFIATTGLSTNDGLTSATPLPDTNTAYALAQSAFDLNLKKITFTHANGTYPAVNISGPLLGSFATAIGGTNVIFLGNVTSPYTGVVIGTSTAGNAWLMSDGCLGSLNGFSLSNSTGHDFSADTGSTAFLAHINYSQTGTHENHIISSHSSLVYIVDDFIISSSAGASWIAAAFGSIETLNISKTIACTISGSPTWATAFAVAQYPSTIVINTAITFSGSSSGPKYSAFLNGVINSGVLTLANFPGSTGGSTTTGGQAQ